MKIINNVLITKEEVSTVKLALSLAIDRLVDMCNTEGATEEQIERYKKQNIEMFNLYMSLRELN